MSTIAAISTPNAAGGIGIIRISGERAIEIADSCFNGVSKKPLASLKGYTAAYGTVHDGAEEIDEGVVIVYRAPKSYTGEDVAEICCHGGLFVMQKALRAVYRAGAVPAEPGEFTKRAFLNGKMDLSEAEAVMKIINASGEASLTAARNTLKGNVARAVDKTADALIRTAAALAAWSDYPDEDIPAVDSKNLYDSIKEQADALKKLIERYDTGKTVTEGVKTVICGKPNVGKSTLMNLLAGFSRSIVTPVAGTTRDVVEETVRVGDVLLRLADTAGIHETGDLVESIGVDIAREKIGEAGLVLAVFDASRELDGEDLALMELCKDKRTIAVVNKTDLEEKTDRSRLEESFDSIIYISAKDVSSGGIFEKELNRVLGVGGLDFTSEMLASERQRRCCEQALSSLDEALSALQAGITVDAVNVCIDSAIESLLTLTGKKAAEEVVNEVFRSFCVGK